MGVSTCRQPPSRPPDPSEPAALPQIQNYKFERSHNKITSLPAPKTSATKGSTWETYRSRDIWISRHHSMDDAIVLSMAFYEVFFHNFNSKKRTFVFKFSTTTRELSACPRLQHLKLQREFKTGKNCFRKQTNGNL